MTHNTKHGIRLFVISISVVLLTAIMFSAGGLNASAYEVTSTPFPTAVHGVGFSRQNPVSPNTRLSIQTTLDSDGTVIQWEMSISQIEFGPATTAKIAKLNKFNEKPPSGKDYLIAYAQGRIFSIAGKTQTFSVSSSEFGTVSDGNILTAPDSFLISGLDPMLSFKGFAGAKFSGWVVLLVFSDDPTPLITYALQSDGIGGAWLSTGSGTSPTEAATEIATASSTKTQIDSLADPIKTSNDFMNALTAKDFTTAYGMIHPSQETSFGGSPDGMQQLFTDNGWEPISFTSPQIQILTSGDAVATLSADFGGTTKYVTIFLRKDGDRWKIIGFNVNTNQPTLIPTVLSIN